MEKLIIVLLFLGAMIIGKGIFTRLLGRMMNSAAAKGIEFSPEGETDLDRWKASGCGRNFENAEMELPAEDFFENETTELQSLEEAFAGLSAAEAEKILNLAGISSGGKEGKGFE